MALSITHPIRCGVCGIKFVRSHANERKCINCKRPSERARLAAARPVIPAVPSKLAVRRSFPNDEHSYTTAERERAVALALKLARTAGKAMLADHVADLLTYARSVASGVVPGQLWQTAKLGYLIKPCDGRRNPSVQPRQAEQPETLTDAEAAEHGRPVKASTAAWLKCEHARAIAEGRQGCICGLREAV